MSKSFSGCNIEDFFKGQDQWSFYIPPITPSKHHSVLYEFPIPENSKPQPHKQVNPKHWDEDHVRMPYSPENLYPVEEIGTKGILVSRWELICEALGKPLKSFSDLEKAISSYNRSIPKLTALENFFEHVLSEEESEEFFENILPKIIKLALSLPEILPAGIPLLKKHHNRSISISQLQVSSLLANAFLCTFPWKKEVSHTYPGVNFIRLYTSNQTYRSIDSIFEKIKCILHYFQRVTKTEPKGVITIERKFSHRSEVPRWDNLQNNLGNTKVHITNKGTIEDDGLGFLQVDFANKNVGGGVLGHGCVQEEIRFVICPELLVSRLFVEQLDDTEAVVVRGVERFSKYTGYSDTFKWDGNYVDVTPFDKYGRRQTSISIIDATPFFRAERQYQSSAILRELNKAYVGFSCHHKENLAPVATGNWGCGAFNGDVKLKTLIQLMACNAAHRDLVYYTFGDRDLQENLYSMYLFIASNRIKTCELWRILCRFAVAELPENQLYSFIQQCWFDIRDKPEIIFPNRSKRDVQNCGQNGTSPFNSPMQKPKQDNQNTPTTSRTPNNIESISEQKKEYQPSLGDKEKTPLKNYSPLPITVKSSPSVDASASPQLTFSRIPTNKYKEKTKLTKEYFEKDQNDLLKIFSTINGPPIGAKPNEECDTLLTASDKWIKSDKTVKEDSVVIDIEENQMEVDVQPEETKEVVVKPKSKITDFFPKISKS
ncbi:poly(ADP-ribose) glycohydrolase-like [Harmonia axyridis]|uniref:poly(ADP-ribose) glycohydrolase-like n=1 Tax=Harmonia axyridis TaxID=115357 RepID=UPI001E2751DE|nr:poly(ADP-ribose) glycohydrolase-like [Harmonia axyridis]